MFVFNGDFVLKSLHSRRLILFLILIQISRIVIFITASVVTLSKQKRLIMRGLLRSQRRHQRIIFFCVLLSQLSIILTSSLCMLREYQMSNLWSRVRTNFKQFSQTEGENVECLLLVSFYVCCFSNSYCFSLSLWGLTLDMLASESIYGGQFASSTQLIKPNYLVGFFWF